MIERVFEMPALLVLGLFSVGAFALGTIVGLIKGEGTWALQRGGESATLALIGGLLARLFVSGLLALAGDSPGAALAIGWGFFLWPGAIDTIPWLFGKSLLTTPQSLLWFAGIVGAATGMMNGFWRIHNWKGLGWLAFPLDVTWGLAGATNGTLLHLINFAWGNHGSETRAEAHRYERGFCVKSGFAFTQGPVMSSQPDAPGSGLYQHERTHVWQNRAFGPMFTLTYVGWMAVWLLPGVIAAAVRKVSTREAVENYCYYNNPWETWAYLVGAGPRTGRGPLVWSDLAVLGWAIPFFAAAFAVAGLIVAKAW